MLQGIKLPDLARRVNENPIAKQQLVQWAGLPSRYYDRMQEAGANVLVAENLNYWLTHSKDRRMVRLLGGQARAFLSDRYNRIENEEIFNAILPVLFERKDLEIVSCEVTEARMYVQAIFKDIKLPVKGSRRVGDIAEAGVTISNSEVGHGAVAIVPTVRFLACLNGIILPDSKFRANHVGRRVEERLRSQH